MPQVINTSRWAPRLRSAAPSFRAPAMSLRRPMLGAGAPPPALRPEQPAPWFVWAMAIGIGGALIYTLLPPERLPPRRRVRANRRRSRTSRRRRRTSRRLPRRNPADIGERPSVRKMKVGALRREHEALTDLINQAYWIFTRTARGKPPSMQVPRAYARRCAIKEELRRRGRRLVLNPISEADKKFAQKVATSGIPRGAEKKKLKAEIRRRLPAPSASEIKKWNRDRGTDIMDAMDDYAKRTGIPRWATTYVLQIGWQDSKGKLKANRRAS